MRSSLRIAAATLLAAIVFPFARAAAAPDDKSAAYHDNVSLVQSVTPSPDRTLASDFSWFDKTGKKVSLADFRGKTVFINFWGTWCRPCKMELPDIVSLVREYEGDVVFIGIAVERSPVNVLQNLTAFAKEQNLKYQLVVGSEDLVNAYGGLGGVPTTLIVNKTGKIVSTMVGMRNLKAFEEELKKVQ